MAEEPRRQRWGIFAVTAIIAAVSSYVLTLTGHSIWGAVTAAIAMPLGFIGLLVAASPRVRGGIVSLFSIFLGAIGVVVAVIGLAL